MSKANLTECADCGASISKRADSCPKCGAPQNVVQTSITKPRDIHPGPPPTSDDAGSVECPYCGYQIAKRVVYNGQLMTCPKCSSQCTAPKKSDCFVATACFQDGEHPTVAALRSFRDKTLVRTFPGRILTTWYYRWGPKLADVVHNVPWLRNVFKPLLTLIAWIFRKASML